MKGPLIVMLTLAACIGFYARSQKQVVASPEPDSSPKYKKGGCYYHKSNKELESWQHEDINIVYVAEVGKKNYLLFTVSSACIYLKWKAGLCTDTDTFAFTERYYDTYIECPSPLS